MLDNERRKSKESIADGPVTQDDLSMIRRAYQSVSGLLTIQRGKNPPRMTTTSGAESILM